MDKIEIVLQEATGEYPASVCVTFLGDKVWLAKDLKLWSLVKVHLNLKANEYNGRYFNNINWWKVDMIKADPGTPAVKQSNIDLPF